MTRSKTAQVGHAGLVCAMLLVTQLTGCGGGDAATPPPVGNNPAPPVPPPPPPQPPPPPPPPPPTVSLTLQGKVTDEPIANAVVTATVAGEEFETTANADGDYSLEIEIPEADADDAFVTLNARGVGAQAFVEFTSVVGSFEALNTAAGGDGTLTATEHFATQITNVTTAAAVLMQQANGGEPITTDAALAALVSQVNAQEVLDLATAIKLAVDDPENHPLPDGTTSILALTSDADARTSFVNTVFEADPAAFAAVQGEIAADPRLAQDIDEAALIERAAITTAMLSTDAGFSFNYTGRIVHYDFEADHTGWLTTETHNVAISWEVDGKQLKITYPEPIETVSYDFEDCENSGGSAQVEAHYSTAGAVVTFLNANQVTLTTTSDITYPTCPDMQARSETTTEARTILSLDMLQPIDEAELAGSVQTIFVWNEATQTVLADVADIGDGTGTTRLTNQTFTWTLEEDGKLVSVDFANGAHADFATLREVDEVVSDIYWEVRAPNDGPVLAGASASVEGEPAGSLDVTEESVVGRFYQFGIGDEANPDARLKGFRLSFAADFTGSQENDFINDSDQLVTDTASTDPINAFRWSIEDDSVVVRRTWDTVAEVDGCLYTDANCELWDVRTLVPLAMEGNRLYVMEVRRTDFDAGVTGSTPATHLVRFYDYEAPEAGMAKLRASKVNGFKSRSLTKGALNR